MTWDEFKAEVDRQLKEQGADGSLEIDYIDVSAFYLEMDADHRFDVFVNRKTGEMAVG